METKMNEKYNDVKVVKTWSFKAFAKEFGTPKFAKCKNGSGEVFNTLAFDKNGEITFCHFSYSTQGFTKSDVQKHIDDIKIGLNTNNKYTAYIQGENSWEEIEL